MAYRIQQGEDPLPEKTDLTPAGNFFYKLNGDVPQDWKIRMMDTIFILYADHEFNASTFAARVTASTLADMYAAVTSACGTLKGPLHGGANEESMKMLDEIKTPDRAEAWMKEAARSEGEDHGIRSSRLQEGRFARADHARDRARSRQTHRQGKWVPICEKLEEVMEREKHLCANVDLYAAPVFHDARVRAGTEHADLCRVARRRLVRARGRAARSQSLDPAALALHRAGTAPVSRHVGRKL